MTKGMRLGLAALLGLVVVGLVGWGVWSQMQPARATSAPRGAPHGSLARESMTLLAPILTNVYFGMLQPEFQKARPRAKRLTQRDEAGFFVFEEELGPELRAIYAVDQTSLTLVKVQIAGRLHEASEIAPRIARMQGRYGSPLGVYDCNGVPGQLPTRRFMYERSALGVMDSYLLVGEQIATTLYIAPLDLLRKALIAAGCKTTPRDRLASFPAVPLPT